MALRWLAIALAAATAGCATPPAPRTQVMGAGPGCDLSIAIGSDHRCAVRHVAPDADQQLLTNGTRAHTAID